MKLPANYNELHYTERKKVREEYVRLQTESMTDQPTNRNPASEGTIQADDSRVKDGSHTGLGAPRWRPEVEKFADLMEAQLRANDHKGGWQDCAPHLLLIRMIEEMAEVLQELEPTKNAAPAFYAAGAMLNAAANELRPYGRFLECKATPERLRKEAADVANFGMMLVDLYGGLEALRFDA